MKFVVLTLFPDMIRQALSHSVMGRAIAAGIIEVEAPWVETTSNYPFKPNMTFQIDTYISTDTFGVRWEKGIAVTETGCDVLSAPIGKLYELEF